jgi:hypothetical protein
MSDAEFSRTGRLAFRVEGTMWNAYWALPHTMEGAIPLGGIRMQFVKNNKQKQDFMDLMRRSVVGLFLELGMPVVKWGDLQDAPEHERGGNG